MDAELVRHSKQLRVRVAMLQVSKSAILGGKIQGMRAGTEHGSGLAPLTKEHPRVRVIPLFMVSKAYREENVAFYPY